MSKPLSGNTLAKRDAMNRIDQLETTVQTLYAQNTHGRETWAEWLAHNHVFVVADYATELASKYGANKELARAAAMLHDIADIEMIRFDPRHEERSLEIARTLLTEHGFSKPEIAIVVDDAIRYHSCHGNDRPRSLEGKILSTSDSLAHLKTDFYLHAMWASGAEKTFEERKRWTLEKLNRDLRIKIQFDDVREDARPDYNHLVAVFSK